MPRQKKLSEEELHPYEMFPYRLEYMEGKDKKICRFTHEMYLQEHIRRYKIKDAKISAKKGWELTPEKPKRKPRKRASDTKASQASKTKKATKPAPKTTSTRSSRQNKEILLPQFSTLDSFYK